MAGYDAIDLGSRKAPLPTIPRAAVLPLVRKVWRRALGRAWPGTWALGRGNHRSYPRHAKFLVNPDRGLDRMIHDMSHAAYDILTRQKGMQCVDGSQGILVWGRWETAASAARCNEFEYAPRKDHNAAHARLEAEMLAHLRELLST
jgi:hypothetical protein